MRIIRLAVVKSTYLDNFLANPANLALVNADFLRSLVLLQYLGQIDAKSDADVNSAVSGGRHDPKYLKYLSFYYDLLSSSRKSYDVIKPFSKILELIQVTMGTAKASLAKADVNANLDIIYSYGGGSGGYGSTKEKQQPLFDALYTKFKSDISSAATSMGKPDLASAVNSQHALLRSDILFEKAEVAQPSTSIFTTAKKLVDMIMQQQWNPANLNSVVQKVYERVKETVVYKAGASSIQQKREIQKQRQQEERNRIDPALLVPGATPPVTTSLEEAIPTNVDAQQWINPYTLSYINAFFLQYYNAILKLPDK